VAEIPDQLSLERHRDLEGKRDLHFRRIGLVVVIVVLVLALGNLFGQRPATTTEPALAADLELYAPSRVRSGLYYEARFTIDANRELDNARLVLDSGWAEGTTMNTLVPSPVEEASLDGRLEFELGRIPRGRSHVLFIQLQVNPTNVGRRSQDVWLYDGPTEIVHLDRTITIFP
jgi:hypothetical protein